jgi:NAD(P)-dependent dehydrogenase (short-subunit alcohol dehydrogenase family)
MTLLPNKNAIVYGGGGPVGSAVAHAFAREGARVFLAGRSLARLEPVAAGIRASGGIAETATVDATDAEAVATHLTAVVDAAGGVDVAFNATGNDDVQGTPLESLGLAEFLRPVTKAMTTQYVIGTTVGRHMAERGSGVIAVMGGGREAIPLLGGSQVAWAALAGLCRQLAVELGPRGVRVVWLLSPGSPDPGKSADPFPDSMVGRHPTYDEVGAAAAFLASDRAATMTATEVNLTGGAVVD